MNTFVVLVEDQPGVLTRVGSLIRRRGFNISSLTVGHTETPGVSRMTIDVEADELAVLDIFEWRIGGAGAGGHDAAGADFLERGLGTRRAHRDNKADRGGKHGGKAETKCHCRTPSAS